MVQVFYSQKIKQAIKKLELPPEARLLGYDFSGAIQNLDNHTVVEIMEKLPTIWKD